MVVQGEIHQGREPYIGYCWGFRGGGGGVLCLVLREGSRFLRVHVHWENAPQITSSRARIFSMIDVAG